MSAQFGVSAIVNNDDDDGNKLIQWQGKASLSVLDVFAWLTSFPYWMTVKSSNKSLQGGLSNCTNVREMELSDAAAVLCYETDKGQ